ncbi:MAG TPA: hypothetical protein VGJ84_05930, partial [Polyangiaceae bacterium]
HISLSGVSNGCEGESGSITITKFGAVGDMIEGSYMISSFVPPVASGCPSTPLEGAFCDRRDPDY